MENLFYFYDKNVDKKGCEIKIFCLNLQSEFEEHKTLL